MATAEMPTEEGKAGTGKKKPSMHSMVLEALTGNTTSKGMSIQAIKREIVTQYPDVQENFSKKRLQTALKKGLDSTEITRPKSSEGEGFRGYFILNRSLLARKEKQKKKAAKTAAKDDGAEKPKKPKTKSTKKDASEKLKGTKSTTKAKAAKGATKVTKVTKKKPLSAKASNGSTNRPSPKGAKRRESIAGTPKLSKADRTKAGTAKTRRLIK